MLSKYLQTQNYLSLPWSDGRYSVNSEGDVISRENVQIECVSTETGSTLIFLDWIRGPGLYPIEFIIASAFKPVHVHESQVHLLHLMFEDGDFNNPHPSNLIWKFPVGLSHPVHKDHAYIPGFTRYGITKEGKVRNLITGVDKKAFCDRDGYHSYSGIPDVSLNENTSYKFFRHRAMCLAWLDYPRNVESLYVNHKNEIPGFDTLDNLEWVTPRGNVIYSNCDRSDEKVNRILENEKKYTIDVITRNVKTNEITIYDNPTQCAIALGLSNDLLYHRLKTKPGCKLWENYMQFQWLSELREWENYENLENEYDQFRYGSAILVKNIITDEVTEYKSARDCSLKLGYSELTVSVRLRSSDIKIYSDGLCFKRKLDARPWPQEKPSLEDLQIKIPVTARNIFTCEERTFESLAACEKITGVSWGVQLSIKNKRLKNIPNKGWQFSFNGQFKDFTDKELRYFKQLCLDKRSFRGNGYFIENVETGETRIITSPIDISRQFGYARQYIPTIARRKALIGGVWRLTLYFNNDEIRHLVE